METKQGKIKILLVDDDEMMRIYFRDIFWIHGRSDTYDITMASSLSEAETIISDKDTKPDTIFLDVIMPIKGEKNSPDDQIKRCLSFVEKVKSNKELSATKIIIYSSQKEQIIQDEGKKLGVDGYLVKGDLLPKELIAYTDKLYESNN